MALDPATLPNDIAALKALLIAADARAIDLDGRIAQLKLTIAKLRSNTFGASSEKGARLLDQLELQLGELVASAAEAKAHTEIATNAQAPADADKPARRPLPAHLPRERLVHAAPCVCRDCGRPIGKSSPTCAKPSRAGSTPLSLQVYAESRTMPSGSGTTLLSSDF